MGPLLVCLVICAVVIAATWMASVLTREYSWVDRIWSVVPVVYVWVFAVSSGFDARLLLMAALVTAWGIRLTFNFARKGGYRPGGEDYRWAVLRERMSPWAYQLFNLFFISIYQNVLILLFCLPAFTVLESGAAPLGV
jgi:steroid 5-alpha reductase family enzyme